MAESWVDRFKALGVQFTSEAGENILGLCPLHDDNTSSLSVHAEDGLWKCFVPSCKGFSGGNFRQFFKLVTGKDYEETLLVPEEEVQALHQALLADQQALKWCFEHRGFTMETLKRFKLGYADNRICIPVYHNGKCINIRRHSIKKGVKAKMLSYKTGYGSLKLFPEEQVLNDDLLMCEGELDAILAIQMGFNAMAVTGGAGSWKDHFSDLFKGKRVNICYDIDQAGRDGALLVCRKLALAGATVKNVVLPISTPPNGDVTDFFIVHGLSANELWATINQTPAFQVMAGTQLFVGETIPLELGNATEPKHVGKPIRFKAMVAGKDVTPLICPKEVNFNCEMGLKVCKYCTIGQANGQLSFKVSENSVDLLRMTGCTEQEQRTQLNKAAGVYPRCPRAKMTVDTVHTLEDVRLIPEISFNSNATAEYVMRQCFYVGHGLAMNRVYEFEGASVADPKSQQATLILTKASSVKDSLESFKVTPEITERLKAFQPKPGQTVAEKMLEIADDLTAHVTRIYHRQDLINVIDLVYHSVLQFKFMGRLVKKGWTEGLILGDTRCGKTETVTQLIEHYKAGEIGVGENSSFAGLIGGLLQMGTRWSIIWGKIPLNDRRLFVIDEASGLSPEAISQMSGVRSSGIAEVIKVQTEKTFARTRLLWVSNPRSPRPLGSYDTGVQAVKELIGRPEDIARFDLAITVASGEVPLEVINQPRSEPGKQLYNSQDCHDLITWAWTRKIEDVHFTKEAEELCLKLSMEEAKRYSPVIPLIEPSEQRIKLARLAVAAAARQFSSTTGEDLCVTAQHVEYVHNLLENLYQKPSMQYRAFSISKFSELVLKDDGAVLELIRPFGIGLVDSLLEHSYIRMRQFDDMFGLEPKEIKPIISRLIQLKALNHAHDGYTKTPAFISFLRKVQAEKLMVPKEEKTEF